MTKEYEVTLVVEVLRAGQPRPYADSEYEIKITGTGHVTSLGMKYKLTEKEAKRFAEFWLRNKPDTIKTKENAEWWQPYWLPSKQIENGWIVKYIQAYLD